MTKSDGDMENKPQVAMTPEEFSLETRFVILNFMGLVPTSNLGERVPLGASWQSSSSGSHKSVSLHSRSSSSSSQILPEFTDEQQILQRVSAHGADMELKKPLAKSRSLPREDSLPEVPRQGGTRPTKAMLMKQLRKTKSAVESSSIGATGQWGGGFGQGLQRGERVEEEFEPLENDTYESGVAGQATFGVHTAELNAISAVRIPSTTPTDGNKLFEITQGLSLSDISTVGINDHETGTSDIATPVISKVHTNDGFQPTSSTSALTTDSLTDKHRGIGIDESDSSETAVMLGIPPDENSSAFRFRGRSESPCRPSTLDLSDDAPRSPGAPNWKVLVQSQVNEPADLDKDSASDADQVDSLRTRSRVQPGGSLAPDAVGETLQDGNQDSAEAGPSSVSAHGETEAGGSSSRPGPNRQHSQLSSVSSNSLPSPVSALGESGRSWVSSRTSLSDLNMVDVAALVNNNVLPPVALPLREELGEQWKELENIYEHAVQNEEVRDILSPVPSSCSPESEVARRLAVIGDQVQEEYGEAIEQAISGMLALPRERLTYEVFIGALLGAGLRRAQVETWKQVALVMLFSQRLALCLLQRGERHLRDLVDLTARAINDRAAGFIIDQGGWHSLSELELDSPVSVSDISTHLLPETDVRQGHPLTDISETDTAPSQDTPDSQHLPNPTGLQPDSFPDHLSDSPAGLQSDSSPGLHHDSPAGAASASSASPVSHTPASDNTVMSASPSDENSNKPLKKVDKVDTTPPAPDPQPVAVNHHGVAASGQLTPEEMKSIEEAVTNVRQEIQLIRQVSADLSMDINNRQDASPGGGSSDTNWHQVAALALLATLGVAIVAVVGYRRGR